MALTCTVTERWMEGPKRYSRGTLLTNNTTYAGGGLDLPAKEQFGFARQMDTLVLMGDDAGTATAYVTSWDKSAHKLQFFEEEAAAAGGPLLEKGAVALGNLTYQYIASGW
jgi:hypothetical protein